GALLSSGTAAEALKPVQGELLSQLVAFGFEPDGVAQPDLFGGTVRIWVVPESNGECGGSISSCPTHRLLFAYVTGDLYQKPVVFQLPPAKGWEFVGWSEAPAESAAFSVRTALPSANIDPEERAAWKPVEYRIVVSETSATVNAVDRDA
ncbi:MAG: hypothetical protein D6816_00410, partial [Bacteroidetes bacterium]